MPSSKAQHLPSLQVLLKDPAKLLFTFEDSKKIKLCCFDFLQRLEGPVVTDILEKESDNSDSVFLQEVSLTFVCVNYQDTQLKPISCEILALQPNQQFKYKQRFRARLDGHNVRKLIRNGDFLVGFGPRDYFVFDQNLRTLS